jgi:ribose/xylose/arabinose/galactoside ABC-type transport system permease subunit
VTTDRQLQIGSQGGLFLHQLSQIALRYGIYLVLLVLCFAVGTIEPSFFTLQNLSTLLLESTSVGIIAVGMTFVIIARGIDVSVGAIVALASAAGITSIKLGGQPWWVGVLIMAGVGLVVGWINGFSSSRLGMPSFLVTLATMTVARGLVTAVSGGRIWYDLPNIFQGLGMGHVGPIPNSIAIMLIAFLVGYLILSKTLFGRQVYAVGTNPDTARVSGIDVERTVLLTFVLVGLLSSLSSLVLTARMNTFTASMGIGYEFSAIAAVVIGGTSLMGGQGNMGGTIVGVLIMAVINNALNLIGVDAYYQDIIRGSIIFLAVFLDAIRQRYIESA